MPHRRSKQAMRKRLARQIILATSYHDPELAETISRVDITYADKIDRYVFTVNVERGEVLIDNRGRGTIQQVIVQKQPKWR